MTPRPFHHGNLRAVLIEEAEQMLREGGVDRISLREIARRAEVSHGAPRSHFVDRQALLDALVERGFERLTHEVGSSTTKDAPFEEKFRQVGHAYVGFAARDAALMELMFAAKVDDPSGPAQQAAGRLFATFDELLDSDPLQGHEDEDVRWRFKLLFAATMQGAATLLASRRVTQHQADAIVDDAIEALLHSAIGPRARTGP